MNKKGQLLSILFGFLVFTILYAMFFASWLTDQTEAFIIQHSLDGLEAFLIANMHIWIFAGLLIGAVSVIYLGGSN